MTIKLYNNSSENNQLNKSITLLSTLTGTLRDSSDIINPIVMIESNLNNSFNYAFIPEFDRYYYITEIKSVRTGLLLLYLAVDPLMSFSSEIAQLKVVLLESESYGTDNYLSDDRVWITKVKDTTSIIKFPSGLSTNGEYVLITAGG